MPLGRDRLDSSGAGTASCRVDPEPVRRTVSDGMREVFLFHCTWCDIVLAFDAKEPKRAFCPLCKLNGNADSGETLVPVSYNRLSHQFQVKDRS